MGPMTETEPDSSKITPLFVLQFCAVLVVILVIAFRPGEWNSARWIGLCVAVPSAVFMFTARWQLGRSFSVTPQARALVTEGIYSKIRNPIYVFSGLVLVGVLIAINYRYAFLWLAVVVPIQIIRAHQEAKVLEAKFGDEYRRYRERTWF